MRIAGNSDGKLTLAFVLGLGIALWSANAGMKAIFDALNIVYDEDEKRGFIKLNAISLIFTLGAVVVLLLVLGAGRRAAARARLSGVRRRAAGRVGCRCCAGPCCSCS